MIGAGLKERIIQELHNELEEIYKACHRIGVQLIYSEDGSFSQAVNLEAEKLRRNMFRRESNYAKAI